MGVDSQGMEQWFSDNDRCEVQCASEARSSKEASCSGGFLSVVAFLTWQFCNYGGFLIMLCQYGSADSSIRTNFPVFSLLHAAGSWWVSSAVYLWESFLKAPNTLFLHPPQQLCKQTNA